MSNTRQGLSPIPSAVCYLASKYKIAGRAENDEENPLRLEADRWARWKQYDPFDKYKPGASKRRVIDAGPHLDFLNVYGEIRRGDQEIRKALQKGWDADQEINEADVNALSAAKQFTERHGFLGLLSQHYLDQPVLPSGKPFIAPEAVFSEKGQLIPIDPATEGRALLSPGGNLDQLAATKRGRAAIAATHFTAPVPYDRIALPSEVSFIATYADHLLPLYDAHAGELVPWEKIKEPFKAMLVLDEDAPARVSVLPTAEPVRLWMMALGFFQLACFPELDGEDEDWKIGKIRRGTTGASLDLTRGEDGGYERNWRCDTLLESIYVMLWLDVTGGNKIRKCQSPGCPKYFRMGSQPGSKHCPGACAGRAASRMYVERQRRKW